MNKEPFWLQNVSILLDVKKMFKIIPTKEMTQDEKLNAVTRFIIYFIVISLLMKSDSQWIYFSLFGILVIIAIHYNDKVKKDTERFTEGADYKPETYQLGRLVAGGDTIYDDLGISTITNATNAANMNDSYSYPISTDLEQDVKSVDADEVIRNVPYEDIQDYNQQTCKKPTEDNPFMNSDIGDIGNFEEVPCDAQQEGTQVEMSEKFKKNLFSDPMDLFERQNSERQFYTVVDGSGVPDTIKFAKWAFGSKNSCKDDPSNCMPYEDPRNKR